MKDKLYRRINGGKDIEIKITIFHIIAILILCVILYGIGYQVGVFLGTVWNNWRN